MRRRRRERAEATQAAEPVETSTTDDSISDPQSVAESSQPIEQAPAHKRRRLLPFLVNWGALLLVIVLIAVTVFVLLLNQGALPPEVVIYWPLAVAVPAALWLLVSLVRRNAKSVLAAAALLGVSISLLLASQNVPLGSTLVGITFITTGAGIMLRGLLLRNQPV
jgi:hypothetical protein